MTGRRLLLPLAVLVSGVYLVFGIRYWFRTPIQRIITVSTVCFWVSWALFLIGG
jgi:hypothetical protein